MLSLRSRWCQSVAPRALVRHAAVRCLPHSTSVSAAASTAAASAALAGTALNTATIAAAHSTYATLAHHTPRIGLRAATLPTTFAGAAQRVRHASSKANNGNSNNDAAGKQQQAPQPAASTKSSKVAAKASYKKTVPLNLTVTLADAKQHAEARRAAERQERMTRSLVGVSEKTEGVQAPPSTPIGLMKAWAFPAYFDPRYEPPPRDAFQKDRHFHFDLFDPAQVGRPNLRPEDLKVRMDEAALRLWHQRYEYWISPRARKRNALKVRQRAEYLAKGWPTRATVSEEEFQKFVLENEAYLEWQDRAKVEALIEAKPASFDPALEPSAMFPYEPQSTPDKYHPSFEPIAPHLWAEYNITARDSHEYRQWFAQWLADNPDIARQREVYQRLVRKYVKPVWRARAAAESQRMIDAAQERENLIAKKSAWNDEDFPEFVIEQGHEEEDPFVLEDVDDDGEGEMEWDEIDDILDDDMDGEGGSTGARELEAETERQKAGKDKGKNPFFEDDYHPLTQAQVKEIYGNPARFGVVKTNEELKAAQKKWAEEFGTLEQRLSEKAWGRVYTALDKAAAEGHLAVRKYAAQQLRASPPSAPTAEQRERAAREMAEYQKRLSQVYFDLQRALVPEIPLPRDTDENPDATDRAEDRIRHYKAHRIALQQMIPIIRDLPFDTTENKERVIAALERRMASDEILREHGCDMPLRVERDEPTDREQIRHFLEQRKYSGEVTGMLEDSRTGELNVRQFLETLAVDPDAEEKAEFRRTMALEEARLDYMIKKYVEDPLRKLEQEAAKTELESDADAEKDKKINAKEANAIDEPKDTKTIEKTTSTTAAPTAVIVSDAEAADLAARASSLSDEELATAIARLEASEKARGGDNALAKVEFTPEERDALLNLSAAEIEAMPEEVVEELIAYRDQVAPKHLLAGEDSIDIDPAVLKEIEAEEAEGDIEEEGLALEEIPEEVVDADWERPMPEVEAELSKEDPVIRALQARLETKTKLAASVTGEDLIAVERDIAKIQAALREASTTSLLPRNILPQANAVFADLAAQLDPNAPMETQVEVMYKALEKLRVLTDWNTSAENYTQRPLPGEHPQFEHKYSRVDVEVEELYRSFDDLLQQFSHWQRPRVLQERVPPVFDAADPHSMQRFYERAKQAAFAPMPAYAPRYLTPKLKKQRADWLARNDAFRAKPEAEREAEARKAVTKRFGVDETMPSLFAKLVREYRTEHERTDWYATDAVDPLEDLSLQEARALLAKTYASEKTSLPGDRQAGVRKAVRLALTHTKDALETVAKEVAYTDAFHAIEQSKLDLAVKAALARQPVAELVARAEHMDTTMRRLQQKQLRAQLVKSPEHREAARAHTAEMKRFKALTPDAQQAEAKKAFVERNAREAEYRKLAQRKHDSELDTAEAKHAADHLALDANASLIELAQDPKARAEVKREKGMSEEEGAAWEARLKAYAETTLAKQLTTAEKARYDELKKEFDEEAIVLATLDRRAAKRAKAILNQDLKLVDGRFVVPEAPKEDLETRWTRLYAFRHRAKYAAYRFAAQGEVVAVDEAAERGSIHEAEKKRAADKRTLRDLIAWHETIEDTFRQTDIVDQDLKIPDYDAVDIRLLAPEEEGGITEEEEDMLMFRGFIRDLTRRGHPTPKEDSDEWYMAFDAWKADPEDEAAIREAWMSEAEYEDLQRAKASPHYQAPLHPGIPEAVHDFPLRFLSLDMYRFLLKNPYRFSKDLLLGVLDHAREVREAGEYYPLEEWDSLAPTGVDVDALKATEEQNLTKSKEELRLARAAFQADLAAEEVVPAVKVDLTEEERAKVKEVNALKTKQHREWLEAQRKMMVSPSSGLAAADVEWRDNQWKPLLSPEPNFEEHDEKALAAQAVRDKIAARTGLTEKTVTLPSAGRPRDVLIDAATQRVWAKKYTIEDWYRWIEQYQPDDIRWEHRWYDEQDQPNENLDYLQNVIDEEITPKEDLKQIKEYLEGPVAELEYMDADLAERTIPNPHREAAPKVLDPKTGKLVPQYEDESQIYVPHRTDVSVPFEHRQAGSLAINTVLHHFELRRRPDDEIAREYRQLQLHFGLLDRQTQDDIDRPSGHMLYLIKQIEKAKQRALEPGGRQMKRRAQQIKQDAPLLLEADTTAKANPELAQAPQAPKTDASSQQSSSSTPVRESTASLMDLPAELVNEEAARTTAIASSGRPRQLDASDFHQVEVRGDEIDIDLMHTLIMENIDDYELVGLDKYGRRLSNQQIDLAPRDLLEKALARIGYIPNVFGNYHLWSNRSVGAGQLDLFNREAMIDLYLEEFSDAAKAKELVERRYKKDRFGDPIELDIDPDLEAWEAFKEQEAEEEESLFENLTEEEIALWKSYHTDEGIIKWIAEGGLFKTQAQWMDEVRRGASGVSEDILEDQVSDFPGLTGTGLTMEENDEINLGREKDLIDESIETLKILQWQPELFVNFFTPAGEFTPEGRREIERILSTMTSPAQRTNYLKEMLHWKQIVGGEISNKDDFDIATWVKSEHAHADKLNADRRERGRRNKEAALKKEQEAKEALAAQRGELVKSGGDEAADKDAAAEAKADAELDEAVAMEEALLNDTEDEVRGPNAFTPDANYKSEEQEAMELEGERDATDADAAEGEEGGAAKKQKSDVLLGVNGQPVPKHVILVQDEHGRMVRGLRTPEGEERPLTEEELRVWGEPRRSLDEEFALILQAERDSMKPKGERNEDDDAEGADADDANEDALTATNQDLVPGEEAYEDPTKPYGGEAEMARLAYKSGGLGGARDREHPLLATWNKPSTLRHVKELPHMDPQRYNEFQSMLYLKQKLYKTLAKHFPSGTITLKLNQPQLFYPERKFKHHYGGADENLRRAVSFGGQSGLQLFQVLFLMRKYRNASILASHIARELEAARMHSTVLRQVEGMVKWMETIPGLDTGLKIKISGRINGSARSRHYVIKNGNIPLQTFHANIDHAYVPAHTSIGAFGVKVWLFQRRLARKEMQSYSLLRGPKVKTRNKFL